MNNPAIRLPELNKGASFSVVRTLLLLVFLIALLGLLYLTQSSQATMTGTHALDLQDRYERLRRENAQLQYEVAVLTAPEKIAARATKIGLRPAVITQTNYIAVKNSSVSLSQPPPKRNETSQPTSSNGLEEIWLELLSRLGLLSNGRTVEASP
jgi:cell division protein FtsL